ncbi:hypothetical protein BS50DRAFT_190877 [Corynespora cassiicola Philippines]|uniref:Secreted protein n=1 Tax=Corynespora cassiicola Philippines TaxID=1448308 RepID=A0A2T2P7C1_CORCC|nr:hypothetical protein BS50DRAFT_190877 [Corynespora cassiicola Philippines]
MKRLLIFSLLQNCFCMPLYPDMLLQQFSRSVLKFHKIQSTRIWLCTPTNVLRNKLQLLYAIPTPPWSAIARPTPLCSHLCLLPVACAPPKCFSQPQRQLNDSTYAIEHLQESSR